jgi:hypothetical protein
MLRCVQHAACAIGRSIGVWGHRKQGKGGGRTTTQKERGDEKEEERKRRNGGCSWPVENAIRMANPTRRRSAGRHPRCQRTGAPNSVRKQERKEKGGGRHEWQFLIASSKHPRAMSHEP